MKNTEHVSYTIGKNAVILAVMFVGLILFALFVPQLEPGELAGEVSHDAETVDSFARYIYLVMLIPVGYIFLCYFSKTTMLATDENGIHVRQFFRSFVPWNEITKIELKRPIMAQGGRSIVFLLRENNTVSHKDTRLLGESVYSVWTGWLKTDQEEATQKLTALWEEHRDSQE